MTQFEIIVPLVALAVALIGTIIIHIADKRLNSPWKDDHPAE